jgi:site-specific DNA-methyltransferase (adenine-specific)
MKDIPDGSIDAIICDPPYGTTRCKWDSIIPLDEMWSQINRVCKQNGVMSFCSSQPFTSKLIMSNPKNFKYNWVWIKNKATGHLNAKKQPLRSVEDICIFYRKQPTYNPQGLVKKDKPTISKGNRGQKGEGSSGEVYGLANKDAIQTHTGYPKTHLEIPVVMKPIHSTQKPVELMEYMIKTYTDE